MRRFRGCLLLICLVPVFALPSSALPPQAEQPQRTDLYGDRLPDGAIARMGTMRFRHVGAAAASFTADGKTLVTAGDQVIRFWDSITGRLLREQPFPVAGGFLAASADARLMAFVSFKKDGGEITLWDREHNQLLHKVALADAKVQFQQGLFTPDGKTLVTAEMNGTLRAWDVTTGKGWLVGKHERQAWSLHFTADGALVSTCRDVKGDDERSSLRFWDVALSRERSRVILPQHTSEVFVSPDGRTAAIVLGVPGERAKGVQFLDVASGQPAKGWIGPSLTPVYSVRFAPDGRTVAISTNDGAVIWDPAAGKHLRTLTGAFGYRLTYSADGKTLAALRGGWGSPYNSWTTAILVWDVASGKARAGGEQGHLDELAGVALSPDGQTIASVSQQPSSRDGTVSLWDTATSRLRYSFYAKQITFRPVVFSPDSKHLFVGGDSAITRYNAATGREIGRYSLAKTDKKPGEGRVYLSLFHLSENGEKLIGVRFIYDPADDARGGSPGGRETLALHAWDVATGKRLPAPTFTVEGPGTRWGGYSRFSADGRLLAIPGGHIRDTTTGRELGRLAIDGRPSGIAAFSPDNALIAAAGDDWTDGDKKNTVQIWETATLLPVTRLATGPVAHLTFTPDGHRVIAAGLESLQLWDVASEKLVASHAAPGRFRGVYGPSFASSFALGADGRTVVTGHKDTTVLLWDLAAPAKPTTPLSAADLETCWVDLAGADAHLAMAAVARLSDEPEPALKLLRERLRPVQPAPPDELRKLITELDSAEFKVRISAAKRLSEWGELAETALKEALRGQPSLETHRRIEELLAAPRLVKEPEARRGLRAIRILEQIATPEARQLLQSLAKGAPEARLTKEAIASLDRLARRGTMSK